MPVSSGSFSLRIACTETDGVQPDPSVFAVDEVFSDAFTNGTGANQFDLFYARNLQLAASSNNDIDLNAFTNRFAQTLAMTKVVGLILVNKSATQTLTLGGGTNPWISWLLATGDGVKVPPGGKLALWGGDANGLGAVVAGTGDILRIANGAGASADYFIAIAGRS